MNKNITRFLFILFFLSILFILIRSIIGNASFLMNQLVNTFYYFTPAIAVILVQNKTVKELSIEYLVNFKQVKLKRTLFYIACITCLFPFIIFLWVYFSENIMAWTWFGKIDILCTLSSFHDICRWFITSIFTVLISGLTYNMIFSLGGEFAWRGFLIKNFKTGSITRNLFTGIIWGTWFMPILFFNDINKDLFNIYGIMSMYYNFIISSFLLEIVYKNTFSLFVPAIIQGIIISSSLPFISDTSLIMGPTGLTGSIALTILCLLFFLIPKEQKVVKENA